MSLTQVVAIAGAAMTIVLGGTFLITQIMVPAKRFEDCVSGGVVGGAFGVPWQCGDNPRPRHCLQARSNVPSILPFP